MEKIILYVDDADYACEHLSQRLGEQGLAAATDAARHWIVVACPPRMTHRVSKWVSHSARENWRAKWLDKTMVRLSPVLRQNGCELTALLAKRPLTELTQQIKLEHGAAAVVDARRPKIGVNLEPVAPGQEPAGQSGWALPGAVAGMGALLVLANELSE